MIMEQQDSHERKCVKTQSKLVPRQGSSLKDANIDCSHVVTTGLHVAIFGGFDRITVRKTQLLGQERPRLESHGSCETRSCKRIAGCSLNPVQLDMMP